MPCQVQASYICGCLHPSFFLEGVSAHTEAIYSFYCLESWHGISTWQVTTERFPDSLIFKRERLGKFPRCGLELDPQKSDLVHRRPWLKGEHSSLY